jgi:hypothetical protein
MEGVGDYSNAAVRRSRSDMCESASRSVTKHVRDARVVPFARLPAHPYPMRRENRDRPLSGADANDSTAHDGAIATNVTQEAPAPTRAGAQRAGAGCAGRGRQQQGYVWPPHQRSEEFVQALRGS